MKEKMQTISYTADVNWEKIVSNAWNKGFVWGVIIGSLVTMILIEIFTTIL